MLSDHYRQNSKIKLVSSENIEIEDKGPGLEEKAWLKSDIERIKLALNNIKPEYQDMIIHHYLDDLSVPEIAQMTGKTEGTVRVNIHRALKSLKRELS